MGMGRSVMVGKEALRQFASARQPGANLHLSSNAAISVDGDHASVESYVMVIGPSENPGVRLAGRYEDRLLRVDGHWRFVSRKLDPQMRATG
jgi:SnoaL-like domain